MNPQFKKILFASDLSIEMEQVFEYSLSFSTFYKAEVIILHVLEEGDSSSEKMTRAIFGEDYYQDLKSRHKTSAQNVLIGKRSDALRIKKRISGFFREAFDGSETEPPIEKILVAESPSVANEIVSTAVDENCDLIIMGCKQKGLLAQAMGDKLVRKVLRRTSVPVFVVPLSES